MYSENGLFTFHNSYSENEFWPGAAKACFDIRRQFSEVSTHLMVVFVYRHSVEDLVLFEKKGRKKKKIENWMW